MPHWPIASLAHFVMANCLIVLLAQSPSNGRMQIAFTEAGGPPTTAVTGTLYFEAPSMGSRQRSISVFNTPLEVSAMPAGTYRVSVVAQTATQVLVSSRVHEVTITPRSTASLSVDLIQRRGSAVVIDTAGAPVSGAHFYTSPSSVNSTADDDGRINLATIATGTALTVRTIQWGMTCHRVTDAERQTIVVPDATEPLVIVTPITPTSTLPQRQHILPSPLLAGALVSGIPGSDCAVPYEHLPVTLAKVNGRTEHTLLLPFGEYTIRLLDGTTLTASAPGRIELS
jgi:hypothetical protein